MNKHNTILGQLLDLVRRPRFEKLVKSYKTEKGAKGLSCWAHFVSMLFGQVSDQNGLRSIEDGINSQPGAFYHLGISKEIKRSTISYANQNRNAIVYEHLFYEMLSDVQRHGQKHGFKFKNPLYSIDATTIDLCLSIFPWADFRETKGGIKLSVKLDHRGKVPSFVLIDDAREHEKNAIRRIPMESGDVIVFDRGYNDYKYFSTLCNNSVYFVTRMKTNACYVVLGKNMANESKGIIDDEIIRLGTNGEDKKCQQTLRRIVSCDSATGKTIVILTNQLEWAASTIAAVYKDRWQIELFFKAIKQNLKIKKFYGTSRNAVYTQIWIALIAYLLFCILKFASKALRTFTGFISVLPTVLFQRRPLWEWFSDFTSPDSPSRLQPELL